MDGWGRSPLSSRTLSCRAAVSYVARPEETAKVPLATAVEAHLAKAPSSPLRDFVRDHAENRPGVYRMVGPEDEILYVGKSIHVRTRLLSYFRATDGEKAHELMQDTRKIAWDYIPDEFGALVREMKLIQKWRPRFNVQHKRRRRFAFVKVTSEKAPRLMPVKRVVEDGSVYYGPFPALLRLAEAARDLAQVLGLRDCTQATPILFADQTELFAVERTAHCLRAQLGSCLAPCAGRTSSAEYSQRLDTARAFLEGRSEEPIDILERQMTAAAARLEFEYASRLRDRADRLRLFSEHLDSFRGHVAGLSFVYKVEGYEGGERLYLIRCGRIRKIFNKPDGRAARSRIDDAVRDVFSGPDRAPSALEPEEAAEILLIARWFRLNPAERGRTVRPERWLAPYSGRKRARPKRSGAATADRVGAAGR